MPNTPIPIDRMVDPQGINLGVERTRDVSRTPMQWDSEPYAGFSTVEPWLPLPKDYATRNVSSQSQDEHSILNLYCHLIWLRRNSSALNGGAYHPLETDSETVYAFLRESDDEMQLVVLNFGNDPLTTCLPLEGSGEIKLSTYLDRSDILPLGSISLRAWEGLVISV
jgi:alpha-glucosidase